MIGTCVDLHKFYYFTFLNLKCAADFVKTVSHIDAFNGGKCQILRAGNLKSCRETVERKNKKRIVKKTFSLKTEFDNFAFVLHLQIRLMLFNCATSTVKWLNNLFSADNAGNSKLPRCYSTDLLL
jgi:DNA replication protein DnaC